MEDIKSAFKNTKKYTVLSDVSYGEHELQNLDIVIPRKSPKDTNLYVRIHGGAWIGGKKEDVFNSLIPFVKKRGMVGANLNYRLLKEGCFDIDCESMLEDIHEAMKKIIEICSQNGIQLKKAILEGESAGAHLALMYAYKYRTKSPVEIVLVYSDCGPTDMNDDAYFHPPIEISQKDMLMLKGLLIGKELTYEDMYNEENMQKMKKVSPCEYVSKDVAPTIFNSCGKDVLVPVSNAERLKKALDKFGVDNYYERFDNSKHCRRDKADKKKVRKFKKQFDLMIDKYL